MMEAGFWIRLWAALLDVIIVGLPFALISYILMGNFDENMFTNLISFLYSLLLPVVWGGYTVGKRVAGVRIRKVSDHSSPGIGTMLLRNVVAGFVYGITFGIAIIVSAFMVGLREDKRSIHDLIAGTEVVYADVS